MTNFRDLILKETEKYYSELNGADFSHDFNHVLRVERLVKKIGTDEGADLQVLEAAALLFDVARILEDSGEISDHSEEGSRIAKKVLTKIQFPPEKIKSVCHAILVHRKSKDRAPETLEAKILQDADYLDALGAIDVARVIASSIQSKKYRRPIYLDRPYEGVKDENASAIHYIIYKISQQKMQPSRFHTKLGRQMAKKRFAFVKEFVTRFIKEWEGKE